MDTRGGVDRALAAPEDGVRASVALDQVSKKLAATQRQSSKAQRTAGRAKEYPLHHSVLTTSVPIARFSLSSASLSHRLERNQFGRVNFRLIVPALRGSHATSSSPLTSSTGGGCDSCAVPAVSRLLVPADARSRSADALGMFAVLQRTGRCQASEGSTFHNPDNGRILEIPESASSDQPS